MFWISELHFAFYGFYVASPPYITYWIMSSVLVDSWSYTQAIPRRRAYLFCFQILHIKYMFPNTCMLPTYYLLSMHLLLSFSILFVVRRFEIKKKMKMRYLSDCNISTWVHSPIFHIHCFVMSYVPPIYVAVFVVGYKLRIVNTNIPSFLLSRFRLIAPFFCFTIQPVFVWCTLIWLWFSFTDWITPFCRLRNLFPSTDLYSYFCS